MKFSKIVAAAFLLCITSSAVQAQTATSRGDRSKIRQGIRTGEITRAETISVARSERKIRKEVRQAKADGVITPQEKQAIRKDKRKSDRKIYRVKHNRRNRN